MERRRLSKFHAICIASVILLSMLGTSAMAAYTPSAPAGALAPPAVCPASIGFGDIIQCSIDSAGETDIYTFTATAGDWVYVRMSASSGNLWTFIEVHRPDGTYLCGAVNVLNYSSVGKTCSLPVTGIYTIQVRDYNHTGIGNYYLFLQRLNIPAGALATSFGQTFPGSLLTPGHTDTYTFTGSVGDKVFMRMTKTTGPIMPDLTVYNPDGTYLCGGNNATNYAKTDITCTLTSSGTHAVLADDHEGTATGDYYFHIQRLNNPGAALTIPFGEIQSGAIATPAEMDAYTFTASAGDRVLASMGPASGTLSPKMRMYDPVGTQVCNSSAFIDSCLLTGSGTYTLLADDIDGLDTGDYHLYLQRLNSPLNTVPIAFGQTLSGTISAPAELDAYTFTASAGDAVVVSMAQAYDTFEPELRMYGPDGTRVCNTGRSFIANCSLTSPGTYIILADDYYTEYTGEYNLYVQRLNNPLNAVSLAFGQPVSAAIGMAAEMDTYTFAANAGDKILAKMTKLSGDFTPEIRIHGPNGTTLCVTEGSPLARIASCNITSPGNQTLLVHDYFGHRVGGYYLYLQRLNNPGNAVPIAFGQTLSGSINTPPQMDTYTFAGVAGDNVHVRMTRSGGSVWPEIAVYGPDGTLLCGTYGYSTADVASCSLPGTGIYTILADEYFQMYTGGYDLYLQRLTNPGNPVSISGNTGVAGTTLSYTDGTPKTATADGSGNYSLTIPYNWSGTVSPSENCHTFSPTNRIYSNVTINQTSQNYTPTIDPACANINVNIGGTSKGTYLIPPQGSLRMNYAGVDSGPVKVMSTNTVPIIAAVRDAWASNGTTTSFAQLMGLPASQLSDTYVFPAYNNVTLNEQLRIGNVDSVPTTVTVTIGGVLRGTYPLAANEAVRVNYPGLDSGPVIVQGTTGVHIIAAERDAWSANGTTTSFVQLMGLPASQLSDKYFFPAYNNVTLNEQLRIGNVDNVPTTVTVTIGGVLRGTYPLAANEAVRVNYAGLDSGPVVVQGTAGVHIIAAERDAWAAVAPYNTTTSFAQLMGLPSGQLSDTYEFPAYNNVTLNEQLRIANVDSSPTSVTVTIGGVLRGTYPLAANEAVRVNYAALDSGPVVIQGTAGVHIIAALRDAWATNGVTTSFIQLMGLPAGSLSDTYLFPAYNNVTLNEQLRFGVP